MAPLKSQENFFIGTLFLTNNKEFDESVDGNVIL